MHTMDDKIVVVTGATSGIGKEVAFQLSGLGAELVLSCRNLERGGEAAEEIARKTHNSKLEVMRVDTSSVESIRAFAQSYRQKYSRLDVLVNNAGVNRAEQPRGESVDGIELTFATNVLGYYLLTLEMLDPLKAAAPSRVINVASTLAGELELDDLLFERRPFDGMKAYAQSKACDRMLARAFAGKFREMGIAVNAMAPGLVPGTGLFSRMTPETRRGIQERGGYSVTQGADTAVWLAESLEVQGVTGKFFQNRQEADCCFSNQKDEERLMEFCRGLVESL